MFYLAKQSDCSQLVKFRISSVVWNGSPATSPAPPLGQPHRPPSPTTRTTPRRHCHACHRQWTGIPVCQAKEAKQQKETKGTGFLTYLAKGANETNKVNGTPNRSTSEEKSKAAGEENSEKGPRSQGA